MAMDFKLDDKLITGETYISALGVIDKSDAEKIIRELNKQFELSFVNLDNFGK